ncbi:MAG TPA: ABC transporter substrate-binding protein [Gemmatimonadaceae bacterium]|nr:ABC transporter substrate-binding protein [Gemmatimonadaceae bacterium]
MRRVSPVAVALLLAGLACRPAPPAEFRVGLIGVFEGTMALSSGIPARDGARLAVDELNAAGGIRIDGRAHRVVLIERETAPRPDAAAIVARGLINLDSVDVIVGPQTSALAIAAGAVAEASDVPMIAPMASNPRVTDGRRFVSRLAFRDEVQGAALAAFAYDSLGIRRAAALHEGASAYGRDITALFGATLTARGGRMVAVETFAADGPRDHSAQLRRILEARPDAILLPSFVVHDSAQIRTARALGFRGVFLGSDAWDILTLQRRDDALGSVVTANWDRRVGRSEMLRFIDAWNARHEERPRATAAATYDAIHLLAEAATHSGARSGPALADALRRPRDVAGAFTQYRWTGTGDPIRGVVLLEIGRDSTLLRTIQDPPL